MFHAKNENLEISTFFFVSPQQSQFSSLSRGSINPLRFFQTNKKKNNLDFWIGSMRLRRKNETTVGRRQGLIQETVVLCGGKSAYGVAYHFAAVSVHGLRSPLRGVFHRHSAAFCFVNAECSILLEALCFA